jgi:hypothetical protein
MQVARKIGIVTLVFFAGVAALYLILSEAVVYFEMWSTNALSRADLADDFGLGLLGVFIVVPGSIVGGMVVGWIAWRRVSAAKHTDVRVA